MRKMDVIMNNIDDIKWVIVGDELLIKKKDVFISPTADQVYSCIIEDKTIFDSIKPRFSDELGNLTFSKHPIFLVIHIDYFPENGGTGLFCSLVAASDKDNTIIHNFDRRKTDHVIINEKWWPFAPYSIEQVQDVLKTVGLEKIGEINFKSYLNLRKISKESDIVQDNTIGKVVRPHTSNVQDGDNYSMFNGTLYPYQDDGWKWLSFLFQQKLGGLLADEMGLGKTVQIIAALTFSNYCDIVPSLVVSPSTLLENWYREFTRFSPTLKVNIHHGPNRTGSPISLVESDVVITSYDTVVRDSSLFDMIDWKVVIVDEAQAIKNPETRRSLAIKKLKKIIGIAVTGTPVENRLRDLWSIVDFIFPGYMGSEIEFEKVFEDEIDGGHAVEPYVSPLMLRRRVKDVAHDLPERIDIPQILTLDNQQAVEYERIRQEIINEYGKSATLVALNKLRMYCTHPILLEDSGIVASSPIEFVKFRRFLEIAEEIFENQEKILVFTSYLKMGSLVVDMSAKLYNIYANTIDGRTPVAERQSTVDRFSQENGPALLALNPRVAGTGLNITAANHVVHYNLEWNPAVEDQASARAHRKGQDKPVTIHRLIIADTIDEVINQRLQRKRDIANAAVVGTSGKESDYEDIMAALQHSPIKD